MAEYTCQQELHFENDEEGKEGSRPTHEKPTSSFSSSRQVNFGFNFFCNHRISEWVLREDSEEPELLRSFHLPMTTKHVRLNQAQNWRKETARQIIDDEIELYLGLCANSRRLLTKFALDKAWKVAKSLPASHNTVHLNICVTAVHKHVFDERRDIRSVMQLSMEEDGYHLVPAADSVIESLESMKITLLCDDSGTCSVCLEEFSECCEAICMPCSHVYHEDCIKKWLKTSHYCPLCRFEMRPTAT